MSDMNPTQESFYFTGVLDYGAQIHANAVVLSGNPHLVARLHRQFGGYVEPRSTPRLVLRSKGTRRRLLEWWLTRTEYRRAEIEAALDSLGS